MSIRPVSTRWFELLVSHEELTDTMESLASTGCVELEVHDCDKEQIDLQDIQHRLHEYARLERHYKPLWPNPDTGMSPFIGSPADILDKALGCIRDWESAARPQQHRLDVVEHRIANLRRLQALLSIDETDSLDFSLLSMDEDVISTRLYLQSESGSINDFPEHVLWRQYISSTHRFLLLFGTVEDLNTLSTELIQKKYTNVQIPVLPAERGDAAHVVADKLGQFITYRQHLWAELNGMAQKYHLAQAIGEIKKMEWFLKNTPQLPASSNFVWITGWSSDSDGERLRKALSMQGARGILHFPDAPDPAAAPLIMQNPWWAKPFELFASMLGTPGDSETDPSPFLALIVPLLFGYMFGDVGQGLILMMFGLGMQKRWPVMRLLVINGASAMVFGFIFGSMFGREDLIPALWLHPITQPLPVLAVPLVAGVVIILLGLTLSALESSWRGEGRRWILKDAPVVIFYLSIIAAVLFSDMGVIVPVIIISLCWYVAGNLWLSRGKMVAVAIAIATLVESMMQLLLNTLSFVRVGAFALAHAGLSMAFNVMADSVGSMWLSLLLLCLGNVVVIVLEGLVVSIQTTRLVLFEFFIRFLQANGRVFRPLSRPVNIAAVSKHDAQSDEPVTIVTRG